MEPTPDNSDQQLPQQPLQQSHEQPAQDLHPEVSRELRKNRLLDDISTALHEGVVTAEDVRAVLPPTHESSLSASTPQRQTVQSASPSLA
jgi:hypothetical protein